MESDKKPEWTLEDHLNIWGPAALIGALVYQAAEHLDVVLGVGATGVVALLGYAYFTDPRDTDK
jgi:hypothetical protein